MPDARPLVMELPGNAEISGLLDSFEAELVGLAPVKEKVRELASLLLIDRVRRIHGFEAAAPTLHMCFLGRPGTGKTGVARRIGHLLYQLEYLRKPTTHIVSREDLVSAAPGASGRRVREAVAVAMGGVLFVDEAYTMCRRSEDAAGAEAVETLMQEMESHRSDLAVVLAGYSERMESFFGVNDGLRSRVAHFVEFPDLDVDELVRVIERFAQDSGYSLDTGALDVLAHRLAHASRQSDFANARTVRNMFEAGRLRHATRLMGRNPRGLTLRELTVLTAEDFVAGTPSRCTTSCAASPARPL